MATKTLITVTTVRMSDMTIHSERTINHDDPKDRSWLGKLCYWAFRNGHGVQTAPVNSEKVGQ